MDDQLLQYIRSPLGWQQERVDAFLLVKQPLLLVLEWNVQLFLKQLVL